MFEAGEGECRILDGARRLFRRRGFDGASIDDIMAEAGLTRGAFYAHFASKEALVSANLATESGLVTALIAASEADDPTSAAGDAFAGYLDPAARDGLIECPMAAHAVDAIRGGGTRLEGYAERFTSLIDQTARATDDVDRATLIAVLAVGGALFASASVDDRVADRIERVCLTQIRHLLDTAEAASH